jgi:serine/threonine protein kinase
VHDFGESGGLYYFAMEFVDGANLREMIRTGKMRPEEALAVVPKICDALQFAHEEGVVHRDVKPENILIDKRGRVKIADFGLAKLLRREHADHTLTMTGMTLGTPRYMAPEQLDKPETVDHRADIYSLGVVFYEMLTGEVPMGRFAPPSEKVRIDVRLDEIVLTRWSATPTAATST